ncbi:lactonase family protein [Hymenobacter psoromatis]|uniref:lactonase family protein n=1 Tax=Hymenobacter psoromatis TaxID=1484116 RepID=UPI001CBC13B8|nr:lactonase family protein [Hymenobacter psoromatis]
MPSQLTPRFFLVPFAGVVLATLLGGCAGTNTSSAVANADRSYLVYVGTNVSGDQASTIYLYRLHATTGELTPLSVQRGGSQPSYLTMDAARRHLYAVSETGTFQGRANSGGVSAFEVNATTGALTLLDQQPSLGASPCYISLDHTGKDALVANYVGGNVALLPLRADGALAPPAATDQHQPPLGPHKNQDHAHAHCFIPDPANRYAFAVDLGTDKVYGYQLDAAAGQLRLLPTPAFVAKPGAGPRHLTFHPDGRRAYLENELNSTVTALTYDADHGTFSEIQTVSTLPAGFTGENSGADVHVSPDGRFLYTSNRGDNSLAVFSIAPADGRLALVQHVSTQGKTPRNFALDPSGRLLLVANQNSDNIFTYRVDKQSGKLTPTEQSVSLPSPMFVEVVADFTK